MKPQIRILLYSTLFFLYIISTFLLLPIRQKLETDLYITLGCGFGLLNIIYAFAVLRWKPLLNIICSFIIASLALFMAVKFSDLHLFSNYDPYDIKTAIFSNALFSVIFWEIVYQIKKRKA
ncbi:hypothetical protein ACFFLS_06335 [Flavobacterium procerum]|uniref:Uncharacterized protein n=1 Tax=Flavobacterium procerum TaxID=1455569 RepID=A0ABV6BRI4_9FLAO